VFICSQDLPKRSDESVKGRFSRIMKNLDVMKLDDETRHALMFKAEKKAEKRKEVNESSSDSNTEVEEKATGPKVIKSSSKPSIIPPEIETVNLSGDEEEKCDDSLAESQKEQVFSLPPSVPGPSGKDLGISAEVLEYQEFYKLKLAEIFACEFSSDRIDWYKAQTRRFVNKKGFLYKIL